MLRCADEDAGFRAFNGSRCMDGACRAAMKSEPSDMPGREQVLGLHSTQGDGFTLSLIRPAESAQKRAERGGGGEKSSVGFESQVSWGLMTRVWISHQCGGRDERKKQKHIFLRIGVTKLNIKSFDMDAYCINAQKVQVDEGVEAYPTESVTLRCQFTGGGSTKLTQVGGQPSADLTQC
ncbi:hypothetical protein FQA47_025045 [Oryzias melastigma]|uniref:Uncharacterized protein n=1 Tax=Oryzias melastigma TaxID=30732 RepID=A0A834CJG6_ORYME|nr:hypothetical protein FQA47_025045 [Oryzias melastigma]